MSTIIVAQDTTGNYTTIQEAANVAVAGDIVQIKNGTYYERVAPAHSGTPGAYIKYANYPGHAPVIDGQDKPISTNIFHIENRAYIQVEGLKMVNNVWNSTGWTIEHGIYVGHSHHIKLLNCTTDRTGSAGIFGIGYSANQQYIEGNEDFTVDGCTVKNANIQPFNELGGTFAYNEALDFIGVTNFVARNNRILGGWKEKMDFKGGGGYEASKFGRVYNNYIDGTPLIPPPPDFLGVSQVGIYDDRGNDVHIFNNYIKNVGIGIALAAGGSTAVQNFNIYNNILTDCYYGIRLADLEGRGGGSFSNIKIYNNDLYNNKSAGINWGNFPSPNCSITKNIFSKNPNAIQLNVGGITVDSNCIFGSSSVIGTNAYLVDPQFIDPDAGNFNLKPTSPIYGKGIGAILTAPPCPQVTGSIVIYIGTPPPPPPPPGDVTLTVDKTSITLGEIVTMRACAPNAIYRFLYPNGNNAGEAPIPQNDCATDTLQPNSTGIWKIQIVDTSGQVLKEQPINVS